MLRALARAIRQPYAVVLAAALIDANRWNPESDGPLPTGRPGGEQRKRA
jgi:hypothetical protein